MFSRNDDLFKFSIDFKSDIYFQELAKIKTHIIHALTENMGICVGIYKRQNIDKTARSNYFNDAGVFFNTMSITTTISLITEEELLKIASSFKTSLCEDKYATLCQDSDPVKIMKQFTKYFYIPVRLSYASIPENVQTNFLKQFITTIIILMFLDQYLSKFNDTIPIMDIYNMCTSQYFQNNNAVLIEKMASLPWKRIDLYLHQNIKKENRVGCYFYAMNRIFGTICVEIINKLCPNYKTVKSINPKYNGTWESPFDTDIADQVRELNRILC